MITLAQAFSSDYAQARHRFLEASAMAGLLSQSHNHPLLGAKGEVLSMDLARDGELDAETLLIITSGCHGVEGFCGSGVQIFSLHDSEWLEKARSQGVAVLYIHALNPYGFSHLRRVTHENVDLNRNFLDFSQPLPSNPAYREIEPFLLPRDWPPTAENSATVSQYIASKGDKAWQAAITQGQHEFETGMFYSGVTPSWSNQTLRAVLREHARFAKKIGWIDLHTGLGPSGLGERIYDGKDDPAALARARRWWDGGGRTPLTSIYDGSSTSSYLTGQMWCAAHEECRQAEITALAMEYGTVPLDEVILALRGDHWLHQNPQTPLDQAAQIKQQLLNAFYVDTDTWKGQVISQARQAMFQAIDGLSASSVT